MDEVTFDVFWWFLRDLKILTSSLDIKCGLLEPKTKSFLGSINVGKKKKELTRPLLLMSMVKKRLSLTFMSPLKAAWILGDTFFLFVFV